MNPIKPNQIFFTLLISLIILSSCIKSDYLYLKQTPPGRTRELFDLDVSDGFFATERIAISADGTEIYFEETNSSWSSFKIKKYEFYNSSWNGPIELFTSYYALALSPDGNSLFMENNKCKDTWITTKDGNGWHPPKRFLKNFEVHSLNLTNSGIYYFASQREEGFGNLDIYKLEISGSDTVAINLGVPLNTEANEGDFFIANDESFIIVMSDRGGGYGDVDLYISFKKANNKWTNPKNMGVSINTPTSDYGPFITKDNKYLFYASGYNEPNSIYWIRVDKLIDSLKNSNFLPYRLSYIRDQTSIVGNLFTYTIPDSIFFDDNEDEILRLTASLSDGSNLPNSFRFNIETETISAKLLEEGCYDIKITATDSKGASTYDIFSLTVTKNKGSQGILCDYQSWNLNEQDRNLFQEK